MSSKKILVLNKDYQVLDFISEEKALLFLYKEKVEIIDYWHDTDYYTVFNQKIKQPSILRFNYMIKRHGFKSLNFSKRFLARRDKYSCQYCAKKLGPNQITIDHIHPQKLGGKTTYTNCVIACFECNNKKDCKTLAQANMKLLSVPTLPSYIPITMLLEKPCEWNQSWDDFFKEEDA